MAIGKKTGGRVAGTPNKATRITRDIINSLSADMYDQVLKDIATLDPNDRVKVWLKLCEFSISKPQTVSLDMIGQSKKTIEDKLKELSATEEE
ncbi:MAG: hypothetical protein RSA66_08710 [Muribaculaceae bacterium]